MNPRSKIKVIFCGKDVNSALKKDIETEISQRMIDNSCPEGSSVYFYFDNIVRKRSSSGVYVTKVQAVDIVVVVRHNSNEAVKGNIKPGLYPNGEKITVKELQKYLTPVIKKKTIEPRFSDTSQATDQTVVVEPEVSLPKTPYTQSEVFAPEFKALFVECLPVFFKEAKGDHLAARDLAPLFNDSQNSFCESGRCISVRMTGMLLSLICEKDDILKMANNGRPYAIYSLNPSKQIKQEPKVEPEVVSETAVATLEKNETPVLVTSDIEALKVLLKNKDNIQKLKQGAQREVLIRREALALAEAGYESLDNDEKQVDTELEKYRDLYKALNGVFG